MNKTALKLALPALALSLIVGCRSGLVYNVDDTAIMTYGDSTPSMQQVERAIVSAATSLGWNVKREGEGKILAVLQVRDHRAVTEITYDADSFSINYKDSINLNYDGTNIHSNYNGWIQRLENAIQAQTGLL